MILVRGLLANKEYKRLLIVKEMRTISGKNKLITCLELDQSKEGNQGAIGKNIHHNMQMDQGEQVVGG